ASARGMTCRVPRSSVRPMSPKRGIRTADVALAAAAALALIVEGAVRAEGHLSGGAWVLAVAAAVPLAWRIRAPLAALVGVETGAVLCAVAFHAGWAAT